MVRRVLREREREETDFTFFVERKAFFRNDKASENSFCVLWILLGDEHADEVIRKVLEVEDLFGISASESVCHLVVKKRFLGINTEDGSVKKGFRKPASVDPEVSKNIKVHFLRNF